MLIWCSFDTDLMHFGPNLLLRGSAFIGRSLKEAQKAVTIDSIELERPAVAF